MSINFIRYDKWVRRSIFFLSTFPAIYLSLGYIFNDLGINPFARMIKVSGHTTIVFVLITLGITPLRRWLTWCFSFARGLRWGKRLADWNMLIKLRKMIGIYAFFYGSTHIFMYLYFEIDFHWQDIYYDFIQRNFLVFGGAAWIFLFLLTITSPLYCRKKMGRWWRKLHRLMYPLAILSVCHAYYAVKVTERLWPTIYFLIAFIFLLHRVLVIYIKKIRRADDTGLEASR